MAGKEEQAKEYLKRHKIMELLDNLTSQLIYDRPGDPKEYMRNYLEKLKKARTVQRGHPCLFDDTNIKSLFGMLDVTGNGFITFEQYKEGLETLGVEKYEKNPIGNEIDKISSETFLKEARQGLLSSSSTY